MASTTPPELAKVSLERQFSLLIAGIHDYAIFLLSPDGIVSSWNAGAERIKGYAASEIIGQHFSRFYTPEDLATDLPRRALKTARQEGKFEAEGWRLRKDGSRFWASVVIDALYDEHGNFFGFAKITRDITERRNAAEALKQAQEAALRARTEEYRQLLRLVQQAPGFVCFFRGPTHVYELQNEAHHRLAGYKDIIGKPVRTALPELEGQGFYELLDQVYTTGEPYVGRALPLRVSPCAGMPGEERFIDFIYQPIVDEQAQVVGIFSQGNDVTEQVHAEKAVKHKQQELERMVVERTQALEKAQSALALARELQVDKSFLLGLFEQAPGFTCVLKGPDHVFELANKAYRRLIGPREFVGRPVREAIPEVVEQGFIDLLDRVYQTGEPFVGSNVPLDIEQEQGCTVKSYLDFIYQPIRNADNTVAGIFVQGNDVTAKKQAQDEVKRYQNDLERLVRERTEALEEAREALQRSQKLEAIGKLTGGVAHDFNNILQVIGGNLQLLHGHLLHSELASKRLETSLGAVERGAKLASQLLAFARRQPLQPVVTNPRRISQNMDDLLRRTLGETIDIETISSGGLWNMLVDPNQLENVLLNLAINARDAMPEGGKLTIELQNVMLDDDYARAETDVQAGQYVMVAISDTGTGMTREVLERACDPFFTTKPEGVGTGLGLSMAYGFVKQSGGHFKIYSEVGEGTTIKMYFPRSYEVAQELPAEVHGTVLGGSETVLVVEDDVAVQMTAVAMLKDLGYRVLKADDAESALGILKSGLPIDVMFTDVVMPGRMRSPELARLAKQMHPHIEILFTSGYTQNAIVHGGRLDPGVQLLSKPYRRDQLARKIRHMLNNRQQTMLVQAAPVSEGEVPPPQAPKRRVLIVEDNLAAQAMACEIVGLLGHEAKGVAMAEDALQLLAREQFDVLFTDVSLPGISGIALARQVKREHPRMRVVFASGYGSMLNEQIEFRHEVLAKPYRIDDLQALLNRSGEEE